MDKTIRIKLILMMVLEFFIWGAWFPLIFGYLPSLGFSAAEQSWILNAFPIAAIVGMFFSNQFADRNFAAEKFLAVSHLIGGVAMLSLAFTRSFWPFFGAMLVHCLLYVPTISITNSIAFAHMKDRAEGIRHRAHGRHHRLDSGGVAVHVHPRRLGQGERGGDPRDSSSWLGTVLGLRADRTGARSGHDAGRSSSPASRSLLLAAFSLALPHTPPKPVDSGANRFAWLEAVPLLRTPFILVLWIVTFVDATVHNLFFNWTGTFLGTDAAAGGVGIPGNWIMPVMSIGQIAEILTMLVLGVTLKRLGWRTTMIVGILGHAARFAVFAFLPEYHALVIAGQILHGIAYAFFFATVYIFVDEFFPKDVRASAQGLFNLHDSRLRPAGGEHDRTDSDQRDVQPRRVVDFRGLFLVPLLSAIGAAIALALLFHPPQKMQPRIGVPATSH